MFQFGYAQEIITPPVGVGLAGYFNKRPNKGMYDDLYVKVVMIESAGKRFGFMAFDLLGYSKALVAEMQSRIVKAYGIDALPEPLKDTALLRIANPEASLADLARLSDPPVSKSCLSHRLKKLMSLLPES